MSRVVIDADAFMDWFAPGEGRRVRDEYEGGLMTIAVPAEFATLVMEAAARRGWGEERLRKLGPLVGRLGFELRQPPSDAVGHWLSRGLTSGQAVTAALAASIDAPLVSADSELRRVAAGLLRRD